MRAHNNEGQDMANEQRLPSFLTGTRKNIVANLLGRHTTAVELATILKINESAIRRHLDLLEKEGFVVSRFEISGKGRPKKLYSLTSQGRSLFPRKTRELLSLLIKRTTQRFGEGEVESLMLSVARDFATQIVTKKAEGTLFNRLNQLVQILDDYGFFTSLSKQDDKYVIEYRNCVFEDVIGQFGKYVCKIDEEITREIAGNVNIEWKECIAKGDRRCLQVISPT
jgi:predicted ArsR family transcriptional regulator